MPSTYRPVSILLLLIPGSLYALSMLRRGKFYDTLLLLFVVYFAIYSFILYAIFGFSYLYLLESIVIFLLGVLTYYGFNYAFENFEYEKLFKSFQILVNLFLFVATVDLILFLSGDFLGLRSLIFNIIADKVGGRPQYTTSEAAWASQITLFLIPIQTWIYRKTQNYYDKIKVGYLYLLIIFTFSLLGYVLLLAYISIKYIYENRNKLKAIVQLLFVTGFTLVVIFGSLTYFASQDNYTLNRLKNFYTEVELTDIYNVDASAYIRTLYPKVGYDIFIDYPLGIGVGGYSYMFGEYIVNYDYEMLYNPETQRNIREKNTNPKNFYSKILSEFGAINGFLFALLIYLICRKDVREGRYDTDARKFIFSLNVVILLVFLQFSSLVSVPFWFCVALNKNYEVLLNDYKVYLTDE